MVHQSKDKVFKFMFDGFPQELLYYFNVNEIFVEFLETEFIDQNGNKKVLDKLAKVLRNFLIDFEPHSSRINIQTLLNFEQYQMLTRAKYNMEVAALSCHGNAVHPDKSVAAKADEDFRKTVLMAEALGVKEE